MDRHYHNAYLLFSDKFRARVSEQRFIEVWSQINRSASGGVKSMEWNRHIEFTTDTGSGARKRFSGPGPASRGSNDVLREGMVFTKEAGVWEIDDIPSLFQEMKGHKRQ